ncbi:MmcQ/YjbR family DNA-binding protein [Lacticaseibacillus suibinensis]|uniref:MmcQ/YjbR family DNA-binding protein n=1 Tax=Lacticaseibacillus suibinensis TaxID=2486011 RepID=UPI000F76833B|nr:MmcQ/YjbR family DNA-binding protein [Lacticaseibacillus suibinensis]
MSSIQETVFANRQPDWPKFAEYGFKGSGTDWAYTSPLVGELQLTVTIHGDTVTTTVIDGDNGAPYVLHLDPANSGLFVGQVRGAYLTVLEDIAAKCFTSTTFASGQSAAIIAELTTKYNETPEFLWQKFPNNAIIRRADNRKWYALLVKVAADKVGLAGSELVDLLIVRAEPATITAKLQAGTALPAYHMNKQHWLSYQLNQQTPLADLMAAIEASRKLA